MSKDEHLLPAAQPFHLQHDFTGILQSQSKVDSPKNLGTKNFVRAHHCKPSNQTFLNTNLQLKTLRQKVCQYSEWAWCEATGGNSFQGAFKQEISIVTTDITFSVQRKRENKVYHSRLLHVYSKKKKKVLC